MAHTSPGTLELSSDGPFQTRAGREVGDNYLVEGVTKPATKGSGNLTQHSWLDMGCYYLPASVTEPPTKGLSGLTGDLRFDMGCCCLAEVATSLSKPVS